MESWSSWIRFLQWGWLCKGCWWTWEWGSGFREYRLFWFPCSYSFNFPVFLSLPIPQSFSSFSSLHLFTFLLPSSSLLLCVFRRTKYSFPFLSSLSVHCSHLAPVTHIQEDSFFTVWFFFPSLLSLVETDLIGRVWDAEIEESFLLYHFTNVRGICEMKLAGNKDESEVLSTVAFYVLIINHENRVN